MTRRGLYEVIRVRFLEVIMVNRFFLIAMLFVGSQSHADEQSVNMATHNLAAATKLFSVSLEGEGMMSLELKDGSGKFLLAVRERLLTRKKTLEAGEEPKDPLYPVHGTVEAFLADKPFMTIKTLDFYDGIGRLRRSIDLTDGEVTDYSYKDNWPKSLRMKSPVLVGTRTITSAAGVALEKDNIYLVARPSEAEKSLVDVCLMVPKEGQSIVGTDSRSQISLKDETCEGYDAKGNLVSGSAYANLTEGIGKLNIRYK